MDISLKEKINELILEYKKEQKELKYVQNN
jgi:hypothetical protein